ncbi:MAG: MurT ligase domain-containing protein [Eggerthellaceae bacterium]|nr:MurT ligase domain-containing protein [Eggerthellaceae bacterium]
MRVYTEGYKKLSLKTGKDETNMGVRQAAAKGISALSTWGLRHVFHRPAENFPGKLALYADPHIISGLAKNLQKGSVVVCGTNGKTTVSNLIADTLEKAHLKVICNRGGANLDSGIATALLQAGKADWGIFECDELWVAKVLPQLKSDYLLLLNLFHDQLDRVGEITAIQDAIIAALKSSPQTTFVFNADDPLCAAIAAKVLNPTIALGLASPVNETSPVGSEAELCQMCSGALDYVFRSYGQLGSYACRACDFGRPSLDFAAFDIKVNAQGLSFTVLRAQEEQAQVVAAYSGAYMVYNLLAVVSQSLLLGASARDFQEALDDFDPQNGRLQRFAVEGKQTLLNLAKNPVGFDQNLSLIMQDTGSVAAAFFVNDKEGDGHDVSWLWDIDFEKLATHTDMRVFAGGARKNDVQLRLKYAGISAELVEGAHDIFDRLAQQSFAGSAYLIANYTALPRVKEELLQRAQKTDAAQGGVFSSDQTATDGRVDADTYAETLSHASYGSGVRIVHLFCNLLNDKGNLICLKKRCEWRAIPVEVVSVTRGQKLAFAEGDIVLLGDCSGREQMLALEELQGIKEALCDFVENDGVLLATGGSFQLLGHECLVADEKIAGLGLLDMVTKRTDSKTERLVSDVVLETELAIQPVVGYENHTERTFLGSKVRPFGQVISSFGFGNNETEKLDGVLYKNLVGSYVQGPLLAKNPQIADVLLKRALQLSELPALDDTAENEANAFMLKRLGIK